MHPSLLTLLLLALSTPLFAYESDENSGHEETEAEAEASQREEPKVKIKIEGVEDSAMLDNIMLSLTLERQKSHPLLGEERINILHRRAQKEIAKALIPFGYYSPDVTGKLSRQEGESDRWIAQYNVVLGQPVRYSEFAIRFTGAGSDDAKFKLWQDNIPIALGDPVVHPDYESLKASLLQLSSERGYLDAELSEHRVEVSPESRSATLRLQLDTGERYQFGPVSFAQTPLRESFLQRFVPFSPGDRFNATQLLDFQRTLTDSDYFERVVIEQQRDGDTDLQVPIHVALKMKKPTRYSIGIGYGTDTGPRASLGIERRYVNSRGHQVGMNTTLSKIRTELYTYYHIPLKNPVTDRVTLSSGYTEERTDTSSNYKRTLAVSTVHQINAWQRILSLTHERESYDIGSQSDRTDLLIPGMTWQRIETDNRINTRNGWLLRIGLQAAAEEILSDVSFGQYQVTAKLITSYSGGVRRIIRADFGSTVVSDLERLPVSHRFFAGGDRSVRGFNYHSLGPMNAQGDVVGGRHLLVGSIEFEHPIKGNLSGALFYDAGNALNSTSKLKMYEGAGFGIRYKLPFGSIRLDLAWPVLERPATPHIHLGLGPDL